MPFDKILVFSITFYCQLFSFSGPHFAASGARLGCTSGSITITSIECSLTRDFIRQTIYSLAKYFSSSAKSLCNMLFIIRECPKNGR